MIDALSPAYLARLASPTGHGDLEPADLAGETGSIVGGAGVRVTLRLARGGYAAPRVAAARFQSLGSAAARGPGSVLCERLEGLTVEEARALGVEDLLAPLGPALPPAVRLAAARLVEALGRALDDGAAAARVDAPGLLVCRCMGVGDREVRRAIRRGAEDVETIGIDCAAGTGCHSCWPDLRALLSAQCDGATSAPPSAADPVSRAIDAVVRPLWRAQGLALGAVERVGDLVRLEMAGAEPDALASAIGGVALARHALRETVDEALRVELLHPPPPPAQREGSAARYRG